MGVSSAQVTAQRSRRATPRRGSQTRFANPDTQVTRGSAGDTAVVVSSSNRETSSETRKIAARHPSVLKGSVDSINLQQQHKLPPFASKPIGQDSYDTSTLLGYFDRTYEPNFSSFQRTDAQLDSTADKRQDHFSTLTTFQLRCIHAMADIIMCPYTALPVSIGLFTRPGVTSREAYMPRLFTYLKELQKQEEPSLEERAGAFDLTSAFLPPAVALLLSYILSLLFGWQLGLTVGLTSVFLYLLFLAIVIFGGYAKNWKKAIEIGETVSRYSRSWRLILDILFNQPPRGTCKPKHVRLIPITLNLGASYTAWDAAVQLSEKMWAAGATKYSMLAMHLQWAGKDIPIASDQRCRKSCCLPLWFWSLLCLLSSLTFATVLRIHGVSILTSRAAVVNGSADRSFEQLERKPAGDRVSTIVAIASLALWLLSLLILGVAIVRPVCRLLRGRVRLRALSRDFYGEELTDSEFTTLCAVGRDRCETDGCIGSAATPGCFPPPAGNKWPYTGDSNGPLTYTRTDITAAATVAATAAAVAAVTARDKHWHSSSRHGKHIRMGYDSPVHSLQRVRRKLDQQRRRNSLRKGGDAAFLETEDAILLEESHMRRPKRMKTGRVATKKNPRNGAVLKRQINRANDGGIRNSGMPYSVLSDEDDDGVLGTDDVEDTLSIDSSTDACSLNSSDIPYGPRTRLVGKNTTNIELGLSEADEVAVSDDAKVDKLTAIECQLRRQLLETCLILSLLDSRHGSRQTRFLISVDALNDSIGLNRGSIKKIAVFCKLLEKLLFSAPGFNNGAVQWFANPTTKKIGVEGRDTEDLEENMRKEGSEGREEEREDGINLAGDETIPNVILMLMCTEGGSLQTLREFEKQFEVPQVPDNVRDGVGVQSAPTLASSGRTRDLSTLGIVDFWQIIHDSCHLTVYLDEPTPGQLLLTGVTDITDRDLDQNFAIRTNHSGGGHLQTTEVPGDTRITDRWMGRSVLEYFLCDHPLADINCSKLRHLLTHIAFLGRLLRSEGEQSVTLMKPVRSATRGMTRPNFLDVVGAWLCLLLHWPFHTAWLTLFLEEHFRLDERVMSNDQSPAKESHATSTNADQVTLTEGAEEGSGIETGPPPVKVNPVYPADTLSALYLRVLERLAPALTASRRKARSASMSDLGHYSADMASSAGITLRLCELASRDQSALRLANYLHAGSSSTKPGVFDGPKGKRRMTCLARGPPQVTTVMGEGRAFAAGDLTVGDLIKVMSCSPFLNAQTRRWIRAFLSRKGFSFMRSQSKEIRGKATLMDDLLNNAEEPSVTLTTTRSCHVRLKNGLPEKMLSEMTVEDVCRLIGEIVDLSFNQSLRAAYSDAGQSSQCRGQGAETSPLTISPGYTEQGKSFTEPELQTPEGVSEVERASSLLALCQKQVRKLNVSGAVLAVCNLRELRNELGLSFGDWQLFNAVVVHLRQLEGSALTRRGQKKSEELVSLQRQGNQPETVKSEGERRATDADEGKIPQGGKKQRQQCEDLKKGGTQPQQTESDSSDGLKYNSRKIQPVVNSSSAASEKKFQFMDPMRSFAATLDRQPYHATAKHLPACPHFQESLYRRNVQLPLAVHSHFASTFSGLSSPHTVQRYACARSTGDLAGLGVLNKQKPLSDPQHHGCAANAIMGQHLHHQSHSGYANLAVTEANAGSDARQRETIGRWRPCAAAGGGDNSLLSEVPLSYKASISGGERTKLTPTNERQSQPAGGVLYHPALVEPPIEAGSFGQGPLKDCAGRYLITKSGSLDLVATGAAPVGGQNFGEAAAAENSNRTPESILETSKTSVPEETRNHTQRTPKPALLAPQLKGVRPTAHWYSLEVRMTQSEPASQIPSQSHSHGDSRPSSPDGVYTSGASEFSYSQAELEASDLNSAYSPCSSSNSSLSSVDSCSATTSLSKTSADSGGRIKDYENNQYCKRPRHEVISLANQR
ncbi:hypothetical protein AAHC03_04986 [Spirometra sp. Aus1]